MYKYTSGIDLSWHYQFSWNISTWTMTRKRGRAYTIYEAFIMFWEETFEHLIVTTNFT